MTKVEKGALSRHCWQIIDILRKNKPYQRWCNKLYDLFWAAMRNRNYDVMLIALAEWEKRPESSRQKAIALANNPCVALAGHAGIYVRPLSEPRRLPVPPTQRRGGALTDEEKARLEAVKRRMQR